MIDPWKEPAPDSDYRKTPDTIAKQDQAYFDDCYRKTIDAVTPFGVGSRAIIRRQTSEQAASEIADESLDYVFIDAIHSYAGVKHDIALWLPKVRAGGWIGGHDFRNLPRYPGVEVAVREAFGNDIEEDGDCTWFHSIR